MFSKKSLLLVCVAAAFYAMLSYHFIFCGGTFKIIKKSHLTLDYTIFSVQGKKAKSILAIDDLRNDGIGEVLVDLGMISEEEMLKLVDQYEKRPR